MWELANRTPFAVDQCFFNDDYDGNLTWVIGVKATFEIDGKPKGNLSVAEEQVEVFTSPVFRGDEENSSLLYDSDLVPRKDYVDIIINGHAYAQGPPVSELTAGCTVGNWSKALKIIGDRFWGSTLGFVYKTAPREFTEIPLEMERSYGGISEYRQAVKNGESVPIFDLRNPVGTGFRKKKKELVGKKLPNLEYLKHKTTTRKAKRNRVATFGAIPPHWSPRIEFAGTYNENAKPRASLVRPGDFDPRYYNNAPLDQQVKNIEGGTEVSLFNLTPEMDLSFKIPSVTLKFKTWMDEEFHHHEGKLHTIIIEPDYPRIMMVWNTSLTCQYREHLIEDCVITHEIDFHEVKK